MPALETMSRTLWLFCHDKEFIHRHRDIDARVMPLGPARYLLALALHHYAEHHKPLGDAIVDIALEADLSGLRRNRTEADMVRQIYRDLFPIDANSLDATRGVCSNWVVRRSVLTRMEQATASLDRGELDKAEEILQHPSLPDDREPPLSRADTEYVLANSLLGHRDGAVALGLREVDRAWRGGIRGGEIGMVAAPTGVGKTQFLCMMAASAFWQGKKVLFYSFELTKPQIIERIVCACLERGRFTLKKKLGQMDKEWARAGAAHGIDKFKGNFFVQAGPLSWAQLREDLDDFKVQHGAFPDLLLIDSVDDMEPIRKFQSEWEGLKAGYSELRKLAQKYRLPAFSTSQFTREAVERARVSLKHIGGAYSKTERCHYVIGLAQTPEALHNLDGPEVSIYVLKDTLHGSSGSSAVARTTFGDGENGWSGFEIEPATVVGLKAPPREDNHD